MRLVVEGIDILNDTRADLDDLKAKNPNDPRLKPFKDIIVSAASTAGIGENTLSMVGADSDAAIDSSVVEYGEEIGDFEGRVTLREWTHQGGSVTFPHAHT